MLSTSSAEESLPESSENTSSSEVTGEIFWTEASESCAPVSLSESESESESSEEEKQSRCLRSSARIDCAPGSM